MATDKSRAQRLADHLLDGKLEQFVAERRTQRFPYSWRQVTEELNEVTGLDLSSETVRLWFPQYRSPERAYRAKAAS